MYLCMYHICIYGYSGPFMYCRQFLYMHVTWCLIRGNMVEARVDICVSIWFEFDVMCFWVVWWYVWRDDEILDQRKARSIWPNLQVWMTQIQAAIPTSWRIPGSPEIRNQEPGCPDDPRARQGVQGLESLGLIGIVFAHSRASSWEAIDRLGVDLVSFDDQIPSGNWT